MPKRVAPPSRLPHRLAESVAAIDTARALALLEAIRIELGLGMSEALVYARDGRTDDVEARCLAALDTYAPLTVDRVYRTRDRLLTGRSPR